MSLGRDGLRAAEREWNESVMVRYWVGGFGHRIGAAVVALACCVIPACEKVPLLAPTASLVTVSVSRTVLPIDGTAQVVATVTESSGTPVHNGTVVTFMTTLGAVEPSEAPTMNGQAVVTLRAGAVSGTAEVTAFSGSARSEAPALVTIGGAAAASLSLTASPGTVPAAGGTVTLSARPADADGNLLPGVPVAFSSDAGSLGSSSAVSDALGEARTTLTTDRDTTVTASVGGQTATLTVRVSLLPTVTVNTSATAPTVGDPIPFSVVVAAGSSPIQEVSVNFGDGTAQSLGRVTGTTNVTHTYQFSGAFQVVVTVKDTSGETVSVATVVVVENALPLNVTVSASPTTAQVDQPIVFTATVTQASGTVEIVRYEWTFGDGTTAVTSGNTTSRVYSSTGRRIVEVKAVEKDGRTGTGRVEVSIDPRSPLNVNLSGSPTPGTVDEVVTFTASVSGSTVPISSYAWNFGDGTQVVTTSGNVVNHVFTTAGTYLASVTVTSTEGDVGSSQFSLIVVPLQVEIALTISPQTVTQGGTVQFTATVSPASVIITTYDWVFGDGEATPNGGRTTTHPYESVGVFTVTLTATAFDGTQTQVQGLVRVVTAVR